MYHIHVLSEEFSVCKLKDYSKVDINRPFVFTGSTDEEKSLVCPSRLVPPDATECSDGWRAFRIEGVLDFSLIGVLSRISSVLAENSIGIFAVSTFNTDYVFTRKEDFGKALEALAAKGYTNEGGLM
ncbi:MAG: ACT domain-containing protein [Bacteroidales bacterium]|nr:ACT domain-containing protein [Bacteroidales bacterium]